jgi:dGTPase
MQENLAGYKVNEAFGRQYKEEHPFDFLTDRERIITSKAFRRLEYKTQVFINYEGDHYRTRLTHSLEVGHVAAAIAQSLNLNHILAEIVGLSHDLGHPPFGHAGERALAAVADKFGGFDHNVQTIKIICQLEEFSPDFPGLNLSLPVIEALVKHNGPLSKDDKALPELKKILANYQIDFHSNCSLEGQIAALADDITYLKHDIDDGIRAGFLDLNALKEIKIFASAYEISRKEDISEAMSYKITLRNIGIYLIDDLLKNSINNLKKYNIQTKEELLSTPKEIIAFSPAKQEEIAQLRSFLHTNVYRHYKVNRMNVKAEKIITELFQVFIKKPNILPQEWQVHINNKALLAQDIINYIAGMTDRYAVEEYKRIFDLQHY